MSRHTGRAWPHRYSSRESAEIVALNPLLSAPTRDLSDIVAMQTAIIGEADFLCTRDWDFYS
jgi:predicted nucleic acid-binding protein